MAQIDSVASAGAAALQQFQPRPQNDTATDNRSVPQFQQLLQQPPSAPPSETQTQIAVQQPEPPQAPPAIQLPSGNDTQSLSEILRDANERQAARNESPSSPSALNYNANGAANPAQRPTQAGQLVSLSV